MEGTCVLRRQSPSFPTYQKVGDSKGTLWTANRGVSSFCPRWRDATKEIPAAGYAQAAGKQLVRGHAHVPTPSQIDGRAIFSSLR